ncbi:MAG: pyridoxal 5'-phosphate synthase glutaminase subunit PdxT, partial [Mycobacteriales bacterium]
MPTVVGKNEAGPAATPTIGVLALQGDVHAHAAALAACGAKVKRVRRPEELDSIDGIVIPGGESTTIGALAETYGVFEPLRKRIAAGMPAFGSCAGAILLASEIVDGRPDQRCLQGIDMTVRRNAFGRQVDSFEADLVIEGITDNPTRPGLLRAIFIRAPWIERAGTDVQVLARYGGR